MWWGDDTQTGKSREWCSVLRAKETWDEFSTGFQLSYMHELFTPLTGLTTNF